MLLSKLLVEYVVGVEMRSEVETAHHGLAPGVHPAQHNKPLGPFKVMHSTQICWRRNTLLVGKWQCCCTPLCEQSHPTNAAVSTLPSVDAAQARKNRSCTGSTLVH